MIDKEKLIATVDAALEGSDLYLVDCEVSADNEIRIDIDSDTMVDIDQCVALSRAIEAAFDRDTEDYGLEVGSVGLTSPLKLYRQYTKYIGSEVEVLTKDGRKIKGTLSAAEDTDPVRFTVSTSVKVKHPGQKRPVVEAVEEAFHAEDCKYIRPMI